MLLGYSIDDGGDLYVDTGYVVIFRIAVEFLESDFGVCYKEFTSVLNYNKFSFSIFIIRFIEN